MLIFFLIYVDYLMGLPVTSLWFLMGLFLFCLHVIDFLHQGRKSYKNIK